MRKKDNNRDRERERERERERAILRLYDALKRLPNDVPTKARR